MLRFGFGKSKKAETPQQESPQQECPNKQNCPLFPLFSLETTYRIWMDRYCNSNCASCERYRKLEQGLTVPDNLLPNGQYLNHS